MMIAGVLTFFVHTLSKFVDIMSTHVDRVCTLKKQSGHYIFLLFH